MRLLRAAALVAAGLLAAPVTADWLVTRDGARIETRGEWEEKGRLIVFTDAKGELASIRASEIDLEASYAATVEAKAPPPPPAPAPPPGPSVLTLTDDDVGHVDPATLDGEEEAEAEQEEAALADLVVTSWQEIEAPDGEGVAIRGTLRNGGTSVATQLRVRVNVFDTDGELQASEEATLTSTTLGVSEVLNFRALFPEVQSVASATFDITNSSFATARSAAGPDDGLVDDGAEPEDGTTAPADTGDEEVPADLGSDS